MTPLLRLFLLLLIGFTACKPSYQAFLPTYRQQFSSITDTVPNYSNLNHWAAHPWKQDPSDSMPLALQTAAPDTSADVFFLHPTTFTDRDQAGKMWNASINDPLINAKTDYTSILYQASIFNATARVFAPRYRQAHIYSFYTKDTISAMQAFDTAYADIKTAFIYYLQHHHHNRPIIIASHSQGALHAIRLLKEFFDGTSLQDYLVCAYVTGMYVPVTAFKQLPTCTYPGQTGCVAGWRTYKNHFTPAFVKKEQAPCLVVNPLSWTTFNNPVPRQENPGAVLFNFQKVLPHTNGARIAGNLLWVERPRFPFSFLSTSKNYHAGDFNLFYLPVRNNVRQRLASYFQHTPR